MAREIVLVLARAANGVIGADGSLPWRIPTDLKRFKELTMGRPMIMGRKTFESLPGLLPGRRHIVLTRSQAPVNEGAEAARSVEEALSLAGDGEIAVIGGAEIYALFMPLADRIELTEVHASYEGDTFMPAPDLNWTETARIEHSASGGSPAFAFVTLRRAL